jgi:hypothetical protein
MTILNFQKEYNLMNQIICYISEDNNLRNVVYYFEFYPFFNILF